MQIVIDIPDEMHKQIMDGYVPLGISKYLKNGKPLDDMRSKILYEIYMDGVNMDNEYHGCWVRFKNIETIVNRYMRGDTK